MLAEIVGGADVERLLAACEVEAEGAARSLPVERLAVEVHHLLLRPPDEMALPRLGGIAPQRLRRAEDVMVEQSPDVKVRRLLSHVWSGGEEQEMLRRPGQADEPGIAGSARTRDATTFRYPGQRLGKLVPACLGDPVLGS